MCRLLAVCLAALLWGSILAPVPALAAGAIYVSDSGDTGWCTGRRGQANARSCALQQCKEQTNNNGNCQLALDCARGWGAIAFGPTSGYAMLCEVSEESPARAEVLLACTRAVKDKCDLVETFSERGTVARKEENKVYADTFYAQFMLAKLGYYGGTLDGDPGPTTQAAILKYQQETKGVPVSGVADEATMTSLLKGVGGIPGLVDVMVRYNHTINPTLGLKTWAGNASQQSDKGTPSNSAPTDSKPAANPLQANAKAVAEAALYKESFGLSDKDLDARFDQAFTQIGEFQHPSASVCAKASANLPYSCAAQAVDQAGQNQSTLALDLFPPKSSTNELALVKAKASAAEFVGTLYKTTNNYTYQRKDATTAQSYDGTCFQTLGEKNSPVACFMVLTPRVAVTVLVPASAASTKSVDVDSKKSVSPETDTAKTLMLGALSAFGNVNLPE